MQYKAGKIVAFSCLAQQSSAQSESCVFTSRSAQKFLGNRGSGGKTDHFQVTRHGYSCVFLPEACLLTCWLALPQSRQGNATFCSQVLCSRLKRQTQGWEVARGLVSKFPMAASFLLTTNRQESGPVSHGQNSCCVWSFEKPQNYAVVKASRVGKPVWLGEGGDWGFLPKRDSFFSFPNSMLWVKSNPRLLQTQWLPFHTLIVYYMLTVHPGVLLKHSKLMPLFSLPPL